MWNTIKFRYRGVVKLNVFTALYQTYLRCEESDLVDKVNDLNNSAVLLPIFHTNKRSNNGKDIIEVTLNEEGEFLRAKYLEKNEVIIFPVTESSVARANDKAPHSLCDELSYITPAFSQEKYTSYIANLGKWSKFNDDNQKNIVLTSVWNYLGKDTMLADVIAYLFPRSTYKVDANKILVSADGNNFALSSKDFVTFCVETKKGRNRDVSRDTDLHRAYIEFIENELKVLPEELCDISGLKMYCTKKHRGLMGNAKLISVSNHIETYYGRFDDGSSVTKVGYVTSQKIHNMLKYLLENNNTRHMLDTSSRVVTWPSVDLQDYNFNFMGEQTFSKPEDVDDELLFWGDTEEDYTINSKTAKVINDHIHGKMINSNSTLYQDFDSLRFYVLIIDKVSNGRISIKYFREIFMGNLTNRVSDWYATTNWQYGYGKYRKIKTPSLSQLTTIAYGHFNKESKRIEMYDDALRKKTVERLLPSIVDGKKIPMDIVNKMMNNVSKRIAYREGWEQLLNTACSVLKKYKWDYKREEVTSKLDEMNKSRDYLYGRLLAVIEMIETTAMKESGNKSVTNAEKLWATYIQSPQQTFGVLMKRIRPYIDRLKKKGQLYHYYDIMLTDLANAIDQLDLTVGQKKSKLNEDFVFGYYAQKKKIYTSKVKQEEEANHDEV